MENLPLEVIGNILSRVGSARDVIRASVTSPNWHEAFRKHLHTLSFCSSDWAGYYNLPIAQLEIIITKAILQTSGLERLVISMDDIGEFSPLLVLCWIIYTKGSLRELYYNIKTNPSLNVLDIAGRHKLEVLELSYHLLTGIEPDILILPCLKRLVLSDVTISAGHLCFSINSCPKLESLELSDVEFVISDALGLVTIKITAPLLKRIRFEAVNFDKIVLEVDKVEDLHLKECSIEMLDIIGNGTLKHLMIEDMASMHLNIGDSVENLETVDISNFSISWPKFYKMISKSARLRKLRLWDVMFDDDNDVVDLESIAASFPMLSHLSLCYHLKDELFPYGRQGSGFMENVVFLRVGWSILSEKFADWVDGLLFICPNLKLLVINGIVLDLKDREECQMLGRFMKSIIPIMRKYSSVEIRFEHYEF